MYSLYEWVSDSEKDLNLKLKELYINGSLECDCIIRAFERKGVKVMCREEGVLMKRALDGFLKVMVDQCMAWNMPIHFWPILLKTELAITNFSMDTWGNSPIKIWRERQVVKQSLRLLKETVYVKSERGYSRGKIVGYYSAKEFMVWIEKDSIIKAIKSENFVERTEVSDEVISLLKIKFGNTRFY